MRGRKTNRARHSPIDELHRMPHSSPPMRLLGIVCLLASICLAPLAHSAPTNSVRRLSLQDCIALALTNNLDLKIDRYNPEIELYNLRGAYSGYDPSLNLLANHSRNEAGSRLFSDVITIPGSKSDNDQVTGSLGGLTPWGMNYSLQGNANDTHGESFSVDAN